MALFDIDATAGAARAGTLRLAHGEVQTPAFVPLASNASVRGLDAHEVADLGYEMVLGNTFHLFITPGPRAHRQAGRAAPVHGLGPARSSPTPAASRCSRWGTARWPTRSSAGAATRQSRILSIEEEGVSFRAYTDGAERFMGPETSMEVQAALGSDIALAFDECTPFHVDRDYTLRSMERTHRWLDRCVAWQGEHGRDDQVFYGIVQGGVDRELRAESVAYTAGAGVDGIAIGGSLGEDKDQMRQVLGWSHGRAARGAAPPPAGHRRRGRHHPRGRHGDRHVRLRHPDPPGPPRHRAGARPRAALEDRPDQVQVARRRPAAVRGRRRRSTRAPTCTTWPRTGSSPAGGS